jgi:hypothetical protein
MISAGFFSANKTIVLKNCFHSKLVLLLLKVRVQVNSCILSEFHNFTTKSAASYFSGNFVVVLGTNLN